MQILSKPWIYGLIFVLSFGPGIPAVMAGHLPGSDDFMRLLQVRDWLSGGDWFEVGQSRFISPEGGLVHWSRFPDIGLAALYFPASVLVGAEPALRFAAAVWPMVLFFALLCATHGVMRRLGVHPIGMAFGLLALVFSLTASQFLPGRVDHHGLVILLTMTAFWGVLGQTRASAALAGLVIALMLSVAIEALPMSGVLILAFGLLWIAEPDRHAERLIWFGGALGITALMVFSLDAPGLAGRGVTCDAYGVGHASTLTMGGLLLAGLGKVAGFNQASRIVRLVVGLIAGAVTLAVFVAVAPACLSSPYAALPAEVQSNWLAQVSEARTMVADFTLNPWNALVRSAVPILALGAAGVWTCSGHGGMRLRRAILGLVLLVALAASVWQVRGLHIAQAIAVVAVAGFCGDLFAAWWRARGSGRLALASGAVLLLSPQFYETLAATQLRTDVGEVTPETLPECTEAGAYQSLPPFPALNVFAPLSAGPRLLLATEHRVYGAPYHRNPKGIALVLETFADDVAKARRTLDEVGAEAILFCREGEIPARGSLAATLARGDIPNWLEPVPTGVDQVRFYRIKSSPSD